MPLMFVFMFLNSFINVWCCKLPKTILRIYLKQEISWHVNRMSETVNGKLQKQF